tara:strand:+ start:138 stop:602 length:465 start_codon:yes stop_codon:yes gene_type:complete
MDEKELNKEIEALSNTIKTKDFFTRKLRESDWDTLVKWWDSWPEWQAPARNFLPDNATGGLMVEKNGVPIVAGFIYETNSAGVLFEWVVSNPDYREKDRQDAIEKLLIDAENKIKEMGYNYIFSIGRSKSLIKTHKKLGWHVDDSPSHEILKKL